MKDCLSILKMRLGISTDKRDDYLKSLLKSLIVEFKEIHGININILNEYQKMFLIDFAEFRYNYKGEDKKDIPRHLKWRFNNIYIKSKLGGKNE
ncbi:hypothetical protein [Peptostreptococcus porci]|uniref:hypothetical protein n=1 Tax=Peptostreptococcus porci TaxID=2652282 RepID=UPI002A830A26|nr:hypothetical protein [Peptostreptococcus porci]MDY4128694.1 hypothetical protein [Peptostreptococcus porci]